MDSQTLIFARELAQLQVLRREYESLLPSALDPTGHQAAAEVRTATILFTDLRGFTGLTERFQDDPARLLEILNEHLAAVVKAVRRSGGVVEKFVGDGVLVSFGARSDMSNHRERAMAAAFGVVGENEALNRRRAAEWGFRLEVGLGAATGKVVVGRVGASERSELGVIGDPINVASRLVAQARPGELLLEAGAYHAVASSVSADVLGRMQVRGRSGQVEGYRITLLPQATPTEAVRAAA